MVAYRLPSVGQAVELDRHCPHCGRNGGNIHSGIRWRGIRDIRVQRVAQRRMKCPYCHTTWTTRCEGVEPGRQRTQRLRGIGCVVTDFSGTWQGLEEVDIATQSHREPEETTNRLTIPRGSAVGICLRIPSMRAVSCLWEALRLCVETQTSTPLAWARKSGQTRDSYVQAYSLTYAHYWV